MKCYKCCFMLCRDCFSLKSTHLLWLPISEVYLLFVIAFEGCAFGGNLLAAGSSWCASSPGGLLLLEFHLKFEFNFNTTGLWKYSMLFKLSPCYWWAAVLLQLLQPGYLGARFLDFMQNICSWTSSKCWQWSVQTSGECGKRSSKMWL